MAGTIYLVKKDPVSSKENVEWIQMDGREFYQFIHSPEGRGRYFIHLTDDVSFEADEIYIEAGYLEYRAWQKEYDAHRYLMEQQEDIRILSSDVPVSGGEEILIDTVLDDRPSVEDMMIGKDERERLYAALKKLNPDEQRILRTLYFSGKVLSDTDAGRRLGLSRQTFQYRKKKIISKLSKILFADS